MRKVSLWSDFEKTDSELENFAAGEDVTWQDEYGKSEFCFMKACFLSTAPNSHQLIFSDEVFMRDAPSILGKFLVTKIEKNLRGESDFTTHVPDEIIIGYCPKEQKVQFETTEDGIIKAYAYFAVSKAYASDSVGLFSIDNGRNCSMEAMVETDDSDPDTVISFNIFGLTILGKPVNGSCPDATIQVTRFAEDIEKRFNERKKVLSMEINLEKDFAEEENCAEKCKCAEADMSCGEEKCAEADMSCGKEECADKCKCAEEENCAEKCKCAEEDLSCGKEKCAEADMSCGEEKCAEGEADMSCGKEKCAEGENCAEKCKCAEGEADMSCGKEKCAEEDLSCGKENCAEEDLSCGKENCAKECDCAVQEEECAEKATAQVAPLQAAEVGMEDPVIDDTAQTVREALEAKVNELTALLEQKENIIMEQSTEIDQLRQYRNDIEQTAKNQKVEAAMAEVKTFVNAETFAELHEEGINCKIEEFDAWNNKVKAVAFEQSKKKVAAKKATMSGIWMSIPVDNAQSKGLWD